jgi:hypothetical protein
MSEGITHAPGPYRVRKFDDTKTHSVYAECWGRPIAAVRGRTPEEQAATANLFAASPDLLDAVKLLLKRTTNARGGCIICATDADQPCEAGCMRQQAIAAIAKATGD